ncbi:hypothetical protein [Amaricoccus tamworthensis]
MRFVAVILTAFTLAACDGDTSDEETDTGHVIEESSGTALG